MSEPRDKEFFDALVPDDRGAVAAEIVTSIVSGAGALERAVEWINDNLEPMDVFAREKLDAWARLAGYRQPGDMT